MPSIFKRDDTTARRMANDDSVVVLGLGRFGRSLATELVAGGTEVLGVLVVVVSTAGASERSSLSTS